MFFRLRPAFQLQSGDALEFLNIVRHKRQPAGERLSRNEQIVRTNGLTAPFQVGTNPGCRFRRCAIQRELDDGGNEALDLLPFFGRVLGFLHAAEQFANRYHGDGTISRRDLAQPLHHARTLAQNANAGVRVEQVGHDHWLKVFNWRQLTLLGTFECGVGDVDGIKETFRPRLRLGWLQHHRFAVLPDEYVRRQVDAFGQANGLAISIQDDGDCFHAGESSPNSGQNQARKCEAKLPLWRGRVGLPRETALCLSRRGCRRMDRNQSTPVRLCPPPIA